MADSKKRFLSDTDLGTFVVAVVVSDETSAGDICNVIYI